jgi:hypothetical protein
MFQFSYHGIVFDALFPSTLRTMKHNPSRKEKISKKDTSSQVSVLFENELSEIYWAEKALTVAMPEMIKSAASEELKLSLERHFEDAKKKVDEIFTMLGKEPHRRRDVEMKRIVKEAKELLKDGSWCYDRVSRLTPRRKTFKTRRLYNTERYARSHR